jgi:hypothetical protein
VARSDRTEAVTRSEAAKSLTKCIEFTEAAVASLDAAKWNAAGLAAVHAGIAAADAAVIASAGCRSTSSDHGAVITLLELHVTEFSAA